MAAVSGANAAAIVISALISTLMPLALDLNGYAYWQLFSLYSSFVGFFVLGFNDGVFQSFSDRDYSGSLITELAGLKWVVVGLGLAGSGLTAASMFLFPADKRFAVGATALCILFFGSSGFLTYVNQIAARLVVFASSVLVERFSLLLGTLGLFVLGVTDYRAYVLASVSASLLKFGYLTVRTPEVAFRRGTPLRDLRSEIARNFVQGFPLMLAILVGSTVLVPSRLVVEHVLGPQTFALYSFALTAVLITGTILTSVAQAAFPTFRKLDDDRFVRSISATHRILTVAGAGLFVAYFPLSLAIEGIYPKFAASLEFLGLLFPIFLFQSKFLILLTTLYRKRDQIQRMLVVAAAGMAVNLVVAVLTATTTRSVRGVALGTVISYTVWVGLAWATAVRENGLHWSAWDNLELAFTGYFLACISAPRVLGLAASPALGASLLLYCLGLAAAFLMLREMRAQILGDLSRLRR